MTARLLSLAYRLRFHQVGEWGLDRWIITAAAGAGLVLVVRWLLRGRPPMATWHWGVLGLFVVLALGVLWLRQWASRRRYVVFEPQPHLPAPDSSRLSPTDKVLLRATGRFEVEGKSHFFADLLAYWRTFATREHAVMAIVHPHRFLLISHLPERDIGMWYIFFRPEMIQEISAGRLTFGGRSRPGLRVTYQCVPTSNDVGRQPKPTTEIAYLGFEDEAARARVWADLTADGGGKAGEDQRASAT